MLDQILSRLTDPTTSLARIGTAQFDSAIFTGDASFGSATFTRDARFNSATFAGTAWFGSAIFTGDASFGSATFTRDARFNSATFAGTAWFGSATFNGDALFDSTTFAGTALFDSTTFAGTALFYLATFTNAWFDSATFTQDAQFDSATITGQARFGSAVFAKDAWFDSATFIGEASFISASFERASSLGPLVCGGVLDLSAASFGAPVTVEVAARRLVCRRTRWSETATLWLRYAEADLSDAVFEYPLAVADRQRPFTARAGTTLDESVLAGLPEQARVTSLRGVDAAHLVLTDLDLSSCLFSGTIHLDQLRLEGRSQFRTAPMGVHRHGWLPVRHTHRSTLAEEQHWRHTRPDAAPGWLAAPPGVDVVQPGALAAVYRALRKSYEDSSNEPGAADFYYGEMEMRRADPGTDRAERGLLTAYWALSGYGLRAARALGWLLAAVTFTVLVMMLWGLPKDGTPSRTTGTITGQHITLTTHSPDPANPAGSVRKRLTSDRFEKSLRVVVNSVIFRSSGQDLTTAGTYTEMASRFTEPVLLGLAALAVRGRIKR
ncbi:pentapeptide repeat-containing protein [Actinacidiphila acididurans]|uniref:pentapeptide repeat-containing protein n=1 Tax=Actinacidiphila acididurans TaxID=2784346 RepID=UPI0027DD6D00|nr:pentapeptide repeat-containing protein [Actinacidiphila acididurans]